MQDPIKESRPLARRRRFGNRERPDGRVVVGWSRGERGGGPLVPAHPNVSGDG